MTDNRQVFDRFFTEVAFHKTSGILKPQEGDHPVDVFSLIDQVLIDGGFPYPTAWLERYSLLHRASEQVQRRAIGMFWIGYIMVTADASDADSSGARYVIGTYDNTATAHYVESFKRIVSYLTEISVKAMQRAQAAGADSAA